MTADVERDGASSFLLSCPTEVLFEVCFHLDDHTDLHSLSRVSKDLRCRLGQFVRVVTNHVEPLTQFKDFEYCERADINGKVPDWSINLVELRYGPTMTPSLPDIFFSKEHHMKNYVALVVPEHPRNTRRLKGEYSLTFMNWTIKRLTNVLSGRFVLITPEPNIQVLNRRLENTTIRALHAESLLLTQVDYSGHFPLHMTPKKISIDTCSTRLLKGLCFEQVEDLRVSGPPRGDSGISNFPFQPSSIPEENVLCGLSDIKCPNLKKLEIRNVNHLCNLDFPSLTKIYTVLTTYSPNGPVIPRMENVNMPLVENFDLWSFDEIPIISDLTLPETCNHFCINYQPNSKSKPLAEATNRLKVDLPRGNRVTVVNMFDEVNDSSLKNITSLVTSNNKREIERLTGPEKLDLQRAKNITINELITDPEISRSSLQTTLNISAHQLESLSITRQDDSTLPLNFNTLAADFPKLKTLTVSGVGNQYDDTFSEGLFFPELTSLSLYGFDLVTLAGIFECMDLENMQLNELRLDRCTLTATDLFDSTAIHDLLTTLHDTSDTLSILDISLVKSHSTIRHSKPLKLTNFSELRHLTLNIDVKHLQLYGCHALREINLSYRDTPLTRLTANSLPVLERLSYNVARHDDNDEKEGASPARSIQELCDGIEHFEEWGRIRRDIHVV